MTGSGLFEGATESPGFADGKEPDALRTIGEVAKALGIRQHVLRYWEQQFPVLQPLKRNGGRRYYRPEDIRMVESIDRLVHREGYTLRGARLALAGERPVENLAIAQVNDKAPALAAVKDRLAEAIALNRAGSNLAGRDHVDAAAAQNAAIMARLISLRATLASALQNG